MKYFIVALIFLFPSVVSAASYTVCPSGCDNTTIQGIFNTFDLSNNDKVIVAGGTYNEQVTITSADSGLNAATRVVLTCKAGDTCIIDGQDTRDFGILLQNANNIVTENFTIVNCLKNGHKIVGTTGGTTEAIQVNNITVSKTGPASTTDLTVGTGFIALQTTIGFGSLRGIEYNNCISFDNAKHGFDIRWSVFAKYINCEAFGNGKEAPAHGFSTHPLNSKSSDYVLSSGTVWKRPQYSLRDQVQRVCDFETGGVCISVGPPTATPIVGEFSVVGGNIYVNFGYDIRNHKIGLVRQPLKADYIDCVAHHNVQYTGIDGGGFQADDMAANISYIGCISNQNQGHGFGCFKCQDTLWEFNLAYLNDERGFWFSNGDNLQLYNNTSAYNLQGFEEVASTKVTKLLAHNIAYKNTKIGIRSMATGATGMILNISNGNGLANYVGVVENSIADPLFVDPGNDDFSLGPGSPAKGSVFNVFRAKRDILGNDLSTQPWINQGAY